MDTTQLSGLEFLIALKKGEVPKSPMSQTIPMQLTVVEPNYVEYEVQPDERHLNLQGGIHGGFYAAVLDSVTGAAVRTTLGAGIRFSTIDLNVKMLKAIKCNQSYIAIGQVIRTGKSVLTSEGKIIDREGNIYAFGSATLLILQK